MLQNVMYQCTHKDVIYYLFVITTVIDNGVPENIEQM